MYLYWPWYWAEDNHIGLRPFILALVLGKGQSYWAEACGQGQYEYSKLMTILLTNGTLSFSKLCYIFVKPRKHETVLMKIFNFIMATEMDSLSESHIRPTLFSHLIGWISYWARFSHFGQVGLCILVESVLYSPLKVINFTYNSVQSINNVLYWGKV